MEWPDEKSSLVLIVSIVVDFFPNGLKLMSKIPLFYWEILK